MKIMVIMRGLPGEGKSWVTQQLNLPVCSADHFFEKSGEYVFDPTKLGQAHQECYDKARALAISGVPFIVDNTNTTWKEMSRYVDLGLEFGYSVIPLEPHREIPDVYGRNTHGVPREKWDQMKDRYQPNWHIVKNLLEKIRGQG